MGARPLRRAIQRLIEDPLADFVLRSAVPPGSTVLVDEGESEGDVDGKGKGDPEVKLTVIEPVEAPEPVGVAASKGDDESGDSEPPGDESSEDSA